MKTTKQILYEAAAIVEQGWSKHTAARDAKGYATGALDPAARRFCARGAIERSSDSPRAHAIAINTFISALSIPYVAEWNDAPERTRGEVVLALGFAAEMAGADE